MAISGPIGEVRQNHFHASPILLCPLCCAKLLALRFLLYLWRNFIYFMLRQYYWYCDLYSASRRSPANKKKSVKTCNWRCKFAVLCLLARWRRPASPLSAGCKVAPIMFLWHQYSWCYVACSALSIFPELACKVGSTDRKQKYVKKKMTVN